MRVNNIKRSGSCKNLQHRSKLIKDFADPEKCYIDSYYYCDHFKKRISKSYCNGCVYYNKL
jgi:hypothetical protein